jgi:hypothetical protein
MKMNIKDLVKDRTVSFVYYVDGDLWYTIDLVEGLPTLEFPVPIKDVGTAAFLAHDKAILFMRYIRKHLENLESWKQEVKKD